MYITDGRETTTVALWNRHADSFSAESYMEMAKHNPVIYIFVGVTSCMFDELTEVAALRDKSLPLLTWFGPSASQTAPGRISVAQLSQITNPHHIYSDRYIVNAKIKNVVPNRSWWYLAWTCATKHYNHRGDNYKCGSPKCSGTTGGPRYCLCIVAADPDSCVVATRTASKDYRSGVVRIHSIGAFLPAQITALYRKPYELCISVPQCRLR